MFLGLRSSVWRAAVTDDCDIFAYWYGSKYSISQKNYKITKFPGGSDGKESACNAGNPGLISESGRFPEEGNGNPTQYFSPGNVMDRARNLAGYVVHGVAEELDTT